MGSKFWKDAALAVAIFAPLVRVLRRVDGDRPIMGWLYGEMLKTKVEVVDALNNRENIYLPTWKLIDRRLDSKMSTPLHLSGYYLNPKFCYFRREEMEKAKKILFWSCRLYVEDVCK